MKEIEKLIEAFIESAQYIDDNYIPVNVNEHNKHAKNIIKITEHLDKRSILHQLKPLLNHPTNYVRLIAAYHLLSIDEESAKKVYKEIITKNIPLMSYNAQISLEQWEENKKNTQ